MSGPRSRRETYKSVEAWNAFIGILKEVDSAIQAPGGGRVDFGGLILVSESRFHLDAPPRMSFDEITSRLEQLQELTRQVRRRATAARQALGDAERELGVPSDRLEHRSRLLGEVEAAIEGGPPGGPKVLLRLKDIASRLGGPAESIEVPVTTIYLV
jgi:hypothetical protein